MLESPGELSKFLKPRVVPQINWIRVAGGKTQVSVFFKSPQMIQGIQYAVKVEKQYSRTIFLGFLYYFCNYTKFLFIIYDALVQTSTEI